MVSPPPRAGQGCKDQSWPSCHSLAAWTFVDQSNSYIKSVAEFLKGSKNPLAGILSVEDADFSFLSDVAIK